MGLTWKLALRNISRNRRRTALTMLLISMTLAIMIFTDGFMYGMSDVLVRSATRLYPGDAQIHHVEYLAERDGEKTIRDVPGNILKLNNEPMVENYTLRATDFGMVSSTANNLAVQVVGIDADLEASVPKLKLGLVDGEYITNDGLDTQIYIGKPLAELLEVDLGDRLVVSVNNYELEEIDQRLFRVSGLFEMNSKFFDEGLVFIQLPKAQAMMGIGESVHEIAFNFVDESFSGQTDLPIWQQLSSDTTTAQGWKALMPDLAAMLGMLDYSMVIVGGILFVVAILGVINAMFMSIYERTYEFGVIIAIGTRRTSVFVLILVEGLLLCLGSLIIGSALGAVINLWVGYVGIDYGSMDVSGVALAEMIRTDLRVSQFTELPFFVFIMVMVACIYPAIHAANIIPAKALHKSL